MAGLTRRRRLADRLDFGMGPGKPPRHWQNEDSVTLETGGASFFVTSDPKTGRWYFALWTAEPDGTPHDWDDEMIFGPWDTHAQAWAEGNQAAWEYASAYGP